MVVDVTAQEFVPLLNLVEVATTSQQLQRGQLTTPGSPDVYVNADKSE